MNLRNKLLILAILTFAVVSVMSIGALAAPSLNLGELALTQSVDELTWNVVVPFTANAEVEQVTILAAKGGSSAAPSTWDATNIVYVDQKDGGSAGQFEFVINTADFDETNSHIYIKIGGTAISTAVSATGEQIWSPAVIGFNVTGYVSVPTLHQETAVITLAEGVTSTITADGLFSFSEIEDGEYSMTIAVRCALTRTITLTVSGADVVVSSDTNMIDLLFGDIDGNGIVNSDDRLVIANKFKARTGDDEYDDSADIDGNGIINSDDRLVIANNFKNRVTSYTEWIIE